MRHWILSNPLQVILWAVIGLALWQPSFGQAQGLWQPVLITSVAVSLMFFMHGLALSSESLWEGIKDWRIHLIIQLLTFACFPALGGLLFVTTRLFVIEPIRIGFFILCATSSTIASSVALTAQAKGRVEIAIFNASLSSVLGIFLTPLFASIITEQPGTDFGGVHAILQVVWHLLFPFAAGQAVRQVIGGNQPWIKPIGACVDYLSIALTIFVALCESINQGGLTHTAVSQFIWIGLLALILFIAMIGIILLIARVFGIPVIDQPALLFCGSQKSIANGVPIAKIMFAGNPTVGVMILPLVIYHQCQLFLSTFLADHWAKRNRST
jgi:sodium/bile acid cotransporter 7